MDLTKLPAWGRVQRAKRNVSNGVDLGWSRVLMDHEVDELHLALAALAREASELPAGFDPVSEQERVDGPNRFFGQNRSVKPCGP